MKPKIYFTYRKFDEMKFITLILKNSFIFNARKISLKISRVGFDINLFLRRNLTYKIWSLIKHMFFHLK